MIQIKNKKTKYHKFTCEFEYNPKYVEIIRGIRRQLKDWRDLTFDGELKAWCFSKYYVYEMLASRMDVDHSQTAKIDEIRDSKQKEDRRVEKLKNVSQNELCGEIEVLTRKELFSFQKEAVDFVDKVGGRAIISDPMGVGKTCEAIGYGVYKKYGRVLIISPASVKEHWRREIKDFAGIKANILEKDGTGGGWEIIGYPNIEKHQGYLYKQQYDLIVVDECFPYNTLIYTDRGYKKIGDIVENNLDVSVLSCNFLNNGLEYKKVIGRKKTQDKKLLKVNYGEGCFYCTPEHKIFTEDGYKKAGSLQCGEKLRILRKEIPNSKGRKSNSKILFKALFWKVAEQQTRNVSYSQGRKKRKDRNYLQMVWKKIQSIATFKKKKILFYKVFSYIQVFKRRMEENSFFKNERESGALEREKEAGIVKENEGEKIKFKNKEKTFKNFKANKTQTSSTRGEWESITKTAKKIIKRVIKTVKKLASRICYKNKGNKKYLWEDAKSLQNRHSKRDGENCHRGRWIFSQFTKKERTRQEKRLFFETVRVESVENPQRRSFKKHRRSGEKSLYDIEVEDNHNYFADGILVSNCHYIKNRRAKRTKKVLHLLKKTKDAIFLSGTPIMNRPVEIYNVFNYIKPTPFWGQDGFALRFCGAKETRFGWDLNGASNLEELKRELSFMIRRKKEEVLDQLPDKTQNTLYIEMADWANYNQILNDYRFWLKDNDLNQAAIYAEALTKINYLKQEVAFQKIKQIHKTIEEFLDAGKSIIVFSQYKTLINKIRQKYIGSSATLTGDTPTKERQLEVDRFQKDENCRIFFSTIKAGGVGITLTKADTVVFTDLDWTPAMHEQAEDRAWRHGQKNNVNIYYLISPQTIEEDIWDRLKFKQDIFDRVVEKADIKGLLESL